MASEQETALLRQILDRPEDLVVRGIYADALQSRGDPRGELIALELAGERGEAAALRRAHAATWWPELARLPFRTRNGFVERIHAPASRLAELQPLFAREPVRELELDSSGPIVDPLPATLVRLAVAGNAGGLAQLDRTRLERLELTETTHDSLRTALALAWPAVRTLKLAGTGLPAAWRQTLRDARRNLPALQRLELLGITIDDQGHVALRAVLPDLEIDARLGAGPYELDLAGATLSITLAHGELWRVEVDGAASRVRWRRMLQRTGYVMEDWQLADAAPLVSVASAVARNATRIVDGDELEIRLPTIAQQLETAGIVATFQAYDTMWELVQTARISHDPTARELSVTFLERHVRPDEDEPLFD